MFAIFENTIIKEAAKYWHLIIFFVPLGVVGIWRWSVWLVKKFLSFFYRNPKGNFHSTLSIVVPVYNENPEMFRMALQSWAMNEPDEIIAVIDFSNPELISIFNQFADRFSNARLIVTRKPGKRAALADGIKASKGEIVALVDSDTIWPGRIKNRIMAPFSNPKVGGLTTRQDVLVADTLARKLFKFLLDDRYLTEYPFVSVVSSAVLCLSGRTAVYRRSAIAGKADALANETFWGQKMISGDDKTLTNFVHADGWKTLFLKNVTVYTPGIPNLGSFLKQKLRWARNGLRSDSRVLLSGWIWKRHKILALYMLDKAVSTVTLLLSPVYFAVSLYLGYWQISAIIFAWWMVSRTIKLFPHLRKNPSDIFLLPIYIFMTFVMAVIKVYAFFTLDKQGWITRWDTSRMSGMHPLRQAASFFLTFVFVGGYFLAVGYYHLQTLTSRGAVREPKAVASVISQEPKSVPDSKLALIRDGILTDKKNAESGFYVVRAGDTLYTLRNRYNLANAAVITNDKNVPISNINSISIGQKLMIPVSELRNPLDAQALLAVQSLHRFPLITYDSVSNTIFVKGGGSIVTLSRISRALPANRTLLEQIKPGEWILRANLYIGKNVTLVIDKQDVTYLKMKSDANRFVWIRSQSGNILISNTKITSWDEQKQSPDLNHQDGRSYIVAKASGRMDVVNSDIGYLGYVGLPRRGGPFGGSYGLSWKITSGRIQNDLLTGSVINSTIHDNYFGIYTFGATGVVIRNNDVFNNVNYGIDPHDDSNNLLITGNRVHNNGNHGIIISKRCVFNEISNNTSYDNALHGIMLDRNSNNNIVTGNTVFGNVDGIALYQSNNNFISQNDIHGNKQGMRLNKNSFRNYVEKNQLTSNGTGLHIYGQANGNLVVANNIAVNNLGVSIQDASGNIIYDSLRASGNKKDGHITVASDQNEIK